MRKIVFSILLILCYSLVAHADSDISFSGSLLPLLTALCSAAVMALVLWDADRNQRRWLEDFSIALSMLISMACAVLMNAWL